MLDDTFEQRVATFIAEVELAEHKFAETASDPVEK